MFNHPPGSWQYRPEATTALPNLVLAGDYVRTHTDLATMEGANESARRAVNAILDRVASGDERCAIWPLREPAIFGRAKQLDERLMDARAAGRHAFDRVPGASFTLTALSGAFERVLAGRQDAIAA